jgi:hypothetical protein
MASSNSGSRGGGGGNKRQRASESKTGQGDSVRSGLVSLNKLDYNLSPDLSVAVSRSYKRHFAQQTTYTPSQRSIIILNSGAEYIDPANTALVFSVTNTGTNQVSFGNGSCANLIRRIVLTSRSGDELERIERVNLLAPVLDRYERSEEWCATVGGVQGYLPRDTNDFSNGATSIGVDIVNGVNQGVTVRYVLPLGCISGLFRSFDRLLPSMLMSGLRIEIEWETAITAFQSEPSQVPAVPDYQINDLQVMADSYTLTDSVQRSLNETASLSGLEIVFSSYFNNQSSTNENTSLQIQVRKAVSRALGFIMKVHDNVPAVDTDSTASSPWEFTSLQARIGSLYFPQQPLSGDTVNTVARECYYHTIRGFNKIATHSAPPQVNYADFLSKSGVFAQDLERSSVQKLTGVPINNSRSLEIKAKFADTEAATGKLVDTWLTYVRLCRVYLNNVEVTARTRTHTNNTIYTHGTHGTAHAIITLYVYSLFLFFAVVRFVGGGINLGTPPKASSSYVYTIAKQNKTLCLITVLMSKTQIQCTTQQ